MTMTLIMTATVRDEADLLADWLDYHHSQGVDQFLLLDHRSTDQTPEILDEYIKRGWVTLWRESGLAYRQGQWVTALARLAFTQFQADWVINNDLDEFWISSPALSTQTLKQTLTQIPAAYNVAKASRHNFAALEPAADGPFWQNQIYRFQTSENFIGKALSGKVCHRGSADIIVHHGNHSVSPMPTESIWPETAFEVLHFPARNYLQFERKIRNGGAALAASAEPVSVGHAKRSLYELYLTGQLPNWYHNWAYDHVKLAQSLLSGELQIDTRLHDWMRALMLSLEK